MYDNISWTRISERRNNLTKAYEPLQPYFLARTTKELNNIIFFDVGANIGVYSMIMGKQEGVDRVCAFEPMQKCVDEIRLNTKMNGLDAKIDIFPIVLSDSNGEVTFRKISDFSGSNGVSDTHVSSDLEFETDESIPSKRLDDIMNLTGQNIIIKIDVEGHEYNVLKGAQKILTDNHGFMQIEIHDDSLNFKNTMDFLKYIGWNKIIRVGWDYYFSNLPKYQEEKFRVELTEAFLSDFVDQSLNGERPARRTLFKGFTIELSRKNMDKIKNLLPSRIFKR